MAESQDRTREDREMRDTPKHIKRFVQALKAHAKRKSELYDGVKYGRSVNDAIILAMEELGEIASAHVRKRLSLARQECIDLAHCAMLIAFAIDRVIEVEGDR